MRPTRRRFARKDLAWDYPGVKVQGECLSLFIMRRMSKFKLIMRPKAITWAITNE